MEDTAGHLTNLSTSSKRPRFLDPCVGGSEDADGDGVSDHRDREPDTVRTLERCSDGSYVTDPDGSPGLVSDCRVLVGFANYSGASNGRISSTNPGLASFPNIRASASDREIAGIIHPVPVAFSP